MLKILPNSDLDGINKSLWFAYTLTKEGFKLLKGDKNLIFIL